MQGRVAEAIELCETAVEATRLSAGTHELSWALCELAYARYHAGHLESAIAAAEESARVGGRLAGDTMPAGGGGPGWVLGMSLFEAGEVERALGDHALARQRRPAAQDPGGEVLRLGGPRPRRARTGTQGGRRGLRASHRGARREARPAPADGARPPGAGGHPARRRRAAGRGRAREAVRGGRRRRRRAAAGRLLARARRPRARRRRRARGRRSRSCGRPRASSTRAARSAYATRCAASCADLGVATAASTAFAAATQGSRRAAPRAARHAGRSAAGGAGQGARRP